MKNYITKLLFASFMLIGVSLQAKVLDDTFDISRLKGAKVGYYVGSFDPIHLGHQHVIEQALESRHVEYILIYPVPGGDQFKNRTEIALRRKMVASVYHDHPKVLVTSWTPKKLQDAFSPFASDIEVIGIIGSDVVTDSLLGPDKELREKYLSVFMRGISLKEKHYEDTIGAVMALNARAFIVALRGDKDLSHLQGKIADRPIYAFIQSTNHSSTEVRNAIQNKLPFEHLLAPSVQVLIKQERLYACSREN